MLLGAFVVAQVEGRPVAAGSLRLQSVPQDQGPWSCKSEEVTDSGETLQVTRTYKHPKGYEALAILKGTYTRLGALRDYAVGRVGQGWVATSTEEWQTRLPDGSLMTARVQDLVNGRDHEVSVMWFVSPSKQCSTLTEAEFAGWKQRLWGCREPWVELHLSVHSSDETEAPIEPAKDLAVRLAGAMKEVLASGTGYQWQ